MTEFMSDNFPKNVQPQFLINLGIKSKCHLWEKSPTCRTVDAYSHWAWWIKVCRSLLAKPAWRNQLDSSGARSDRLTFSRSVSIFLTQTVTKSPTWHHLAGMFDKFGDSCGKYEWDRPREFQCQRRHQKSTTLRTTPSSFCPTTQVLDIQDILAKHRCVKGITEIWTWFEKICNDIFKSFGTKVLALAPFPWLKETWVCLGLLHSGP